MNQFIRRSFLGMLAGAVASVPLVATLGHPRWSVILGIAVGAAYAAISRPTRGAYVDNLMAAGALGVPLWGSDQRDRVPIGFRANAAMERRTNASTFSSSGWLGAVQCLARPHHPRLQ